MSAIADFRMIDISKLHELRNAAQPKRNFFGRVKDNYFTYLDRSSTKLKGYQGSGCLYVTLLFYLEEKGINLIESNFSELASVVSKVRNLTCLIFTNDHKEKYLNRLDPSNFNIYELGLYYNNFNETEENNIGKAMLDGIELLYENIKLVNENSVIVFGIY